MAADIMDPGAINPNKALLVVLCGLGILILILVLGIFGVVSVFEPPADCPANNCSISEENVTTVATSPEPVPTPVTQPPAPVQPAPQPTPILEPAPVQVSAPQSPKPVAPATKPSAPPKPALPPAPAPRRGLPEIGYYTFDKAEPGAVPTGWSVIRGEWRAEENEKALSGTGKNIMHQIEIVKENSDAILLSNDTILKNVRVASNIRISNTRTNQTAGIVFRFQDPNHYYGAGLDTKNQQVVLYKTIAGVTRVLAYQGTNRIKPNEWHYLEATATGEHIKIKLNEDDYISTKDYSFTDGKSGIWAMGSTDATFDNAEVRKLP